MIHIFFVPGMFGSTLEYVLRNFTQEIESVVGEIQSNGSMHSYAKQNHIINATEINNITDQYIHTPIYPFNNLHLPEILKIYPVNKPNDKYILVYAKDFQSAELNMIFQYYKIVIGLSKGFKGFCGEHDTMKDTVKRWNSMYENYSDMQLWEFREWLSLFYAEWIQEWQDSPTQVPEHWLKISSSDVLNDTLQTFRQIIYFCGLTETNGLQDFAEQWAEAQQYIVSEYNLIQKILSSTLNQVEFEWQPLNIVSEAIIQQNLRSKGFEIMCDGLNTFPTNSIDLYNLLDKNLQLHHIQGQA